MAELTGSELDAEIRRELAYAGWRRRLRRYSRRYRNGSPKVHPRPWVKYALRGRPSTIETQPGAVERLRAHFLPETVPGPLSDVMDRLLGFIRGDADASKPK